MVAAIINSEKIMIPIMVRGRILAMMILILRVMVTKIGSRNKTNINSVRVMMKAMINMAMMILILKMMMTKIGRRNQTR